MVIYALPAERHVAGGVSETAITVSVAKEAQTLPQLQY